MKLIRFSAQQAEQKAALKKERAAALRRALRPLHRRALPLWGFALSFRALMGALETPLLLLSLRWAMSAAGVSYIGTENVLRFLTRPVSLLLLLLWTAAAACAALFESSALLWAIDSAGCARISELFEAGRSGLRRAFRKGNRGAFGAAVLLPAYTGGLLLPAAIGVLRLPDLAFGFLRIHFFWGAALLLVPLLLPIPAARLLLALPDYAAGRDYDRSLRRLRALPRRRLFSRLLALIRWRLVLLLGGLFLSAVGVGAAMQRRSQLALPWAQGVASAVATLVVLSVVFFLLWPPLTLAALDAEGARVRRDEQPPCGAETRRRLLAACGVLTALAVGLNLVVFRPGGDNSLLDMPVVMAHRGNAATAPENTLPAFQQAMDAGADYIELDIRLSKDGELVVLHDSSLYRTTGDRHQVWQLTLKQLRRLDAGSWFSAEYAGTRIPTLREVLELTAGQIALNIEVKTGGPGDPVAPLCALLAEYGVEDDCVIASTDYHILSRVKKVNPDLSTLFIISVAYGRVTNLRCADAFSLRGAFLNAELVRKAHGMNKAVYAWTLNSAAEIESAIRMGVDGIITDRVKTARSLLYSRYADEQVSDVIDGLVTGGEKRTALPGSTRPAADAIS